MGCQLGAACGMRRQKLGVFAAQGCRMCKPSRALGAEGIANGREGPGRLAYAHSKMCTCVCLCTLCVAPTRWISPLFGGPRPCALWAAPLAAVNASRIGPPPWYPGT